MRVVGALLALGLAVALVLSGCARTPPRAAGQPAIPATTSPTATATVPPPGPLAADGTVPTPLDPALLNPPGLESRTSADQHVYAVWPTTGLPGVDAILSDFFTTTVDDFNRRHGGAAVPEQDAPELNLGWHLVGAAPDAVGIVADGQEYSDGSAHGVWQSFWFDPATDTLWSTRDLLDPARTALALRSAALARGDLALAAADPGLALDATLIGFSRAGDLLVGFDECRLAACSRGRITLTVPAADADALLTDEGRRARAAATQPSAVVPVPPTPVPSATAEPAPTSDPEPSQRPTPSLTPTPPPDPAEVDCRTARCVALTFDDGPGPKTMTLLRHLAERRAPATFFMVGQQVAAYPAVARAVADAGHEIGVHTWDHRSLPQLSDDEINAELSRTMAVLRKRAGVSPTLLRPPFGDTAPNVTAAARRAGLAIVLWDVDTLDWKTRDTKKTVKATLKGTRRGSIVLLHDVHKTSVAAVPEIIDRLREEGYTLVTVSHLLGETEPGRRYSNGKR